jgi:ATP-dependent Clp protease ATP-binding subunit ClpA
VANENHSGEIDTEFLLLGILREDSSICAQWLNISADEFRAEIEHCVSHHERASVGPDIPLSSASKRVLAYGMEEADRLGSRAIDLPHLFLGLLREKGCGAETLLRKHGTSLREMRVFIAGKGRSSPKPRLGPRFLSFLHIFRQKSEKIEEP